MKITNKLGLPQPFVDAARSEHVYKPKRYSATEITSGIRKAILQRRHDDEIEEDVSEMIWAIFGSAVHSILENSDETASQLKESKLVKLLPNGYELSGVFDLYDAETKTVTDYKTCGTYKVKLDSFTEWRLQLLIYAYLLRDIGFEVEHGQIVMILKDHSMTQVRAGKHPPLPVAVKRFDFTSDDFYEIEQFILGKFAQIEEAEKLPDDELPMCTEEERWSRDEKLAVRKKGTQRAKKLFNPDQRQQAEEYAMQLGAGHYVEHRPGIDVHCIDYCSAAPFCSHYKRITEEE